MDANVTSPNSGEISMTEGNKSGEVVVMIYGQEEDEKSSLHLVSGDSHIEAMQFAPLRCASPETARFSPSPNRPPKIPTNETLSRRKSLARSVYSKPKSRFGEQPVPVDSNIFQESSPLIQDYINSTGSNSSIKNMSAWASPNSRAASPHTSLKETARTVSITTPRTLFMASPGGMDEDEEIYKKVVELESELGKQKELRAMYTMRMEKHKII